MLLIMRGFCERQGSLQIVIGQGFRQLGERLDKRGRLFGQLLGPVNRREQWHQALDRPGVSRHDALTVVQLVMQFVNVDLVHQVDRCNRVKDMIRQLLGRPTRPGWPPAA